MLQIRDFGIVFSFKAIEPYSLLPFEKIREDKEISQASQERVRNIIDSCRDNAHSSLHFLRMLAKKGIGVTFRRDHSGEITDYENFLSPRAIPVGARGIRCIGRRKK